jgi:hypothetical protein
MDANTQKSVEKFSGINNVDPSYRLFPMSVDRRREDIFPLKEAMNVDIDNTRAIKSRPGYDKVLTGSDIHSLWSDDKTCLFVDGTVLYQMDDVYTKTAIKTGLTASARMSYVPVNDRIYYTNNFQIGYLKEGADNILSDPAREFKSPLPAGCFIEYFMGCLFVAVGNILYISDPLCDYFDIRTGYRIFTNDIVMLRAVDNGLYVADDKVWFIKGKGNDDFSREEVESEMVIPFTDVRTSGESMGYGVAGDVVVWTSQKGICVGDSSGVVKNITEDRYIMAEHGRGAAFIREISNVRHYINLLY